MNFPPNMKEFLLSFDGRIGRQTFWLSFFVPVLVINIILTVIDGVIGTGGILGLIFGLAILWPSIAVYAKRWHDRGKSGWWTLIVLIPLVGFVWIIVECGFLKGVEGSNNYGDDPVPA